jgi:hypothetical protein
MPKIGFLWVKLIPLNYILPLCLELINVTDTNEELDGLTLNVYVYAVKKGKPVGPRDAMKGVNLSSPSVAYRHLQKLEELGYMQKNEYGEYTVRSKAHIEGFVWFGRRLVPKMWRYSALFLVILLVELVILIIHYEGGKLTSSKFSSC